MPLKYFCALWILLFTGSLAYSQCSIGGNGMASSVTINIDGVMTDWNAILSDPDNNTYDATPDTDAPIADVGRDFTRFAFTENATHLFLYFARAGSSTNSVDLLFYLDVNNNGLMETNEPVITISWSGSNGNTSVSIYNYIAAVTGGDVLHNDGYDMPGSLQHRTSLGNIGRGSASGSQLEVAIPFTQLYKQGSVNPVDMLVATEQFKFHVSSINGSPSSVPGSNSINDNFGGCYSGLMLLPVKLAYFQGEKVNDKANLSWEIADNENAAAFDIEMSEDAKVFTPIGKVMASSAIGPTRYQFVAGLKGNKNYFRLKMFDKDNVAEYSKVIAMEIENDISTLTFNNPVYSDVVIRYETQTSASTSVKLYNAGGALVFAKTFRAIRGQNLITIPASQFAVKGTYIIEVSNHNNTKLSRQLVKL